MSDFAIDQAGLTLCSSSWHSSSWIDEPTLKIYAISTGSGRYAIPGQEIALQAGHLYLIPGGRRQRYGPAQDMRVHWLHVHVLSPVVAMHLRGLDRIRSWPLPAWAWWRPVWESIPAWLERRDLAGELRLQALIGAVVADALGEEETADRLDPRLDAALRWMEAHCREHPPLAATARVAGLAPAVFHRRFRAATGTTPRAWLEARRLEHARRLLRQTGTSVQAVAEACGYANPFHFSRVMRRRLGVSPTQARRNPGP